MLDSFKELELHWDKVNQEFYQSLTGVAGETNGRKVKLYITENGEPLDLTGNDVRFYWRYKLKNYNSITTFTVTDITKGEFYFYIPTEMQGSGDVVGNIAIENAKEKSVLLSKEITIKIAESQFGTGLEETKNKADAITELILDAVPKDITASLAKKVDTSAIIDTAHGGTGSANRSTALNNLSFLGLNPSSITNGTDNVLDTVDNWKLLGTGYAIFNKANINLQGYPNSSSIGITAYVMNYVYQGEVYQEALTSTGVKMTRTKNTWGKWLRISDSTTPIPAYNADSTSTGLAYTITYPLIPTTLPWGYTFKFTPNVVSTSQSATLSINGGTAYPFYKFDSYTGNTVAVSSTNSPVGFLSTVPLSVTFWNNRWILNDEPLVNPLSLSTTVPLEKGGTGNTTGNSNMYTAYSFSSDGTDRFSLKNPSYNLLDGSRDFTGTTWNNAGNTVTDGTYLGLTVKKRTLQWNGINRAYTIQEEGDYTFSAYIKSSGTGGATTRYVSINGTANGTYNKKFIDIGWTRDTVTIPSNLIKVGDVVSVRYDISEVGTNYALYTAGHKWEKGTVATPWMPLQSELKSSDLPTYYGTSSTFSNIQPSKNTDYIWEKSPNSIDARLSNVENSPLPVFNADSTSTGLAYTVTNSFVPSPIPFGYSLKFIPNITSTIQTATLTINGGTVGIFRKVDPQTGTMSAVSSSNSPAGFLQAGNVYSLTYYNGYWILNDTPVLNPLSLSGSVPIEKGGTGSNIRANAFQNLSLIGENPTTVDTDTVDFWRSQGSGWAWYSKTSSLNNQPDRYGFLIQYINPTTNGIFQIFSVSPSGKMYYRTANNVGWYGSTTRTGTWTRLSDSEIPIPVFTADSSSTGMAYTITNSTVPTFLSSGYTFKFTPNTASATQTATLSINGGTAYPFAKTNSYTGEKIAITSSNSPVDFLKVNGIYTLTFTGSRFVISEETLVDTQSLSGAVSIANGGTNATTRGNALKNLIDLGVDPVSSGSDTPSAWQALGRGMAEVHNPTWYGLPTTFGWGSIQNWYTSSISDLFQIAHGADSQSVYVRNGNVSGTWKTSWKKLLDANDFPIGSVRMTTTNTAPATFGTWTNIGNQTIGSKTVYYWERTA